MLLRCDNPVRSCGVVEHDVGARYWICSCCGCCGEPLRVLVVQKETLN